MKEEQSYVYNFNSAYRKEHAQFPPNGLVHSPQGTEVDFKQVVSIIILLPRLFDSTI
jgi:hypothetical protein